MGPDQITKLKQNRILGSDSDINTNDEFYLLSWTCTTAIDPIHMEAADAFAPLANWAYDQFTPYSYPNVLLLDFVGAPWELGTGDGNEKDMEAQITWDVAYLAMAVNIQIASANCWVAANSANA
jgi:hypothetical protein